MAAGGRDLDGAFGGFLSLHVSQVRSAESVVGELGHRRIQHLHAFHVIDKGDQGRRGDDLDAAGLSGFRSARSGADEASLLFRCGQSRGQHARHGGHLRIQG